MNNKYENFASNLKRYLITSHNKLLREEIDPAFKNEKDIAKIVQYLLEVKELTEETYFYLAKFQIQATLTSLEKYFPKAHACMWLYCETEDDLYLLASPNLRNQLGYKYGVEFGHSQKEHLPYHCVISDTIMYLDFHKPPTHAIAEPSNLWAEHGYDSIWLFPFHLSNKPVACLGISFEHDPERLPHKKEIRLINETLKSLEKEFALILKKYDQFKHTESKQIR